MAGPVMALSWSGIRIGIGIGIRISIGLVLGLDFNDWIRLLRQVPFFAKPPTPAHREVLSNIIWHFQIK